ncbi:MAG: hypothetical protein JF614_21080 [Acidobacteria bacterium]|nr:hypothetical protein [Acidobacteriota bacterium]
MSSLVLFTLWMLVRSPASTTPSPAHSQNVVRICSLASGTGCQDLDAKLLEPAAMAPGAPAGTAAGQRAFVDPRTKSLVQPNQDQLKALSVILSESMDRQEDVKVQTLKDGTLRLPGGSFVVNSRVVIENQEKKP